MSLTRNYLFIYLFIIIIIIIIIIDYFWGGGVRWDRYNEQWSTGKR